MSKMAKEISYHDGDIVWVKMNKLWWPGEVHGTHRLPSDFLEQSKKPPLFVVKFFQEQNYHCVNQLHQIARFDCAKKNEFIKKGLDLYYAKHSYMTEFPADVAVAEKRTGGNPNIIYSKEFMPIVKPDKATPTSASKGSTSRSRRGQQIQTSTPSIPRVMIKPDHDTRILMSSAPVTPASSSSAPTTPTAVDSKYKCTSCNFSTNRINTFVWHQKTHSSPKTPQTSTTSKYPTKQTPRPSTVTDDEPKSSSSTKLLLETEATPENSVQSKPSVEIAESMDTATESIDKTPELVISTGKSKAKRARSSTAKEPKLADKTRKTENKLRKILDDWSDDENGEAGPSGLISSNKVVKCTVLDVNDEGEMKQEDKKLKLDTDMSRKLNETEEVESVSMSDDISPNTVSSIASVEDMKTESKSNLCKKNAKDEFVTQSTNNVADDDIKPQTRFSLRSGRTTLPNETSPALPKRRGRAKRSANDSFKSESDSLEVKESEARPEVPEKREAIDSVQTSSSDSISDELVKPAPIQTSTANKSHSKTSRKGKPRRKEEIKLSNNISVAVLVEKTSSCPSTDYGIEQKLDNEFTNVVHKKIRYMDRNSTDEHRKSVESLEAPKLPALTDETTKNEENDRMIVEPENVPDDDTTKNTIHSNDQKEEKNAVPKTNDGPAGSENADLSETNTANSEKTEEAEKETDKLTATQSPDEQLVVQKCYERKVSPKKNLSLDQPETSTTSASFFSDDTNMDSYESTSSSNLRQKSPKRYENTRNRRKSDRRTVSDDDFTAIAKTIDDNCEENGRERRKSVEVNNSLDLGNTKLSEVINGKGDMSENSNSKTSTPEKADSSKELDCFDFTEDECMKPPQVLNRRKRLPPAKVFELDDIDKIEEERKIDEEAARVAQQREEENQKLHAELENLLNSTTPATLPEIPLGPKEHENFPERLEEKDPEKMAVKEGDVKDRILPPKERNKRIFKYRNRNRRPDVDTKVACNVEDTKANDTNDSLQQPDGNSDNNVVTSADKMEQELQLQSTDHVPETDPINQDTPSAHDLKIEIAETLINFPLLSPHTDVIKEPIVKVATTKQPAIKRKESAKNTKNVKKLRATVLVESIPEVNRKETTATMELLDSAPKQHSFVDGQTNSEAVVLHFKEEVATTNPPLKPTDKIISEAHTTTAASSSVRDFSRIRLIEKIEKHSPVQLNDETLQSKTNQLPLKKTVKLTETEGNSLITRIPKKRKSQMDDDVPPAFVIERPKDNLNDASEPKIVHNSVKKEPKSFIVTKTAKKQVTGELPKQNTVNVVAGVHINSSEVNEGNHSHQGTKSNASIDTTVQPVSNPSITPITEASERSVAMETPVVVSSQLIKPPPTTNTQQKRTVATTSTVTANILGSLSANRPCTIAPAKKATYRKPADMTGLTQKQIGIDGKGNPVMVYTKITPIVAQTPPATAQATFTLKSNESNPSTSQGIQSFGTSLPSNQGNQFVITSKGTLITNQPFITTTHSTLLNQPTLTNRPNIIHTQLICSPNPPMFQTQNQQHPSPPSSQIIIQTKPSNSLSQISSVAPTGKKQPPNRRSVGNKAKLTDNPATKPSNDTTATTPALKKRIVRRISKNQPSTAITQQMQPNQQQQIILNSEINYVGSTPVPPLIPLNDQPASMSSRQQSTKQRPTQMNFVPELPEPQVQSKVTHTEVVEQQQENILALPGDTPGFGGPPGSYFLCKLNEMGMYVPIDNQPLYLDVTDNTNLLKPNAPTEVVQALTTEIRQESPVLNEVERIVAANQAVIADHDVNSPKYLINISDGQQLLVDQQGLMALTNGEDFPQFVTSDGHQIILQGGQNDILSAIAFAEDVGLIAGQQILIPEDDLAVIQGQGGNQDILAAALAGTEGFSQEQFIDNVLSTNGVEDIVVDPMVYHAMTQPTVMPLTNAVTNATNAVLTQPPIMSTLEQPTKADRLSPNHSLEMCSQNLDESLAVIGVTTGHTNVPTSLELPITITNPAIAPKSASSMSTIYPASVTAEHDLDYDIFSSSSPITHHLSQPINENYRTVNVINSIGDIDMDSNIVAVAAASRDQYTGRN